MAKVMIVMVATSLNPDRRQGTESSREDTEGDALGASPDSASPVNARSYSARRNDRGAHRLPVQDAAMPLYQPGQRDPDHAVMSIPHASPAGPRFHPQRNVLFQRIRLMGHRLTRNVRGLMASFSP
jgi:hypothetical protein